MKTRGEHLKYDTVFVEIPASIYGTKQKPVLELNLKQTIDLLHRLDAGTKTLLARSQARRQELTPKLDAEKINILKQNLSELKKQGFTNISIEILSELIDSN